MLKGECAVQCAFITNPKHRSAGREANESSNFEARQIRRLFEPSQTVFMCKSQEKTASLRKPLVMKAQPSFRAELHVGKL